MISHCSSRRIEEYIDDSLDVTFFETFDGFEIMPGSYIVKNSTRALHFLAGKFIHVHERSANLRLIRPVTRYKIQGL